MLLEALKELVFQCRSRDLRVGKSPGYATSDRSPAEASQLPPLEARSFGKDARAFNRAARLTITAVDIGPVGNRPRRWKTVLFWLFVIEGVEVSRGVAPWRWVEVSR